MRRNLMTEIERLRAALKPFADYADPTGRVPEALPISSGSHMAKRQLRMSDCYNAKRALEQKEKKLMTRPVAMGEKIGQLTAEIERLRLSLDQMHAAARVASQSIVTMERDLRIEIERLRTLAKATLEQRE